MTELELQKDFTINQKLFDAKILKEEVPYFARNIDIVILDSKNNIISIEVKLNDIKTVIKQAKICLQCSDYVYILLPERNLKRDNLEILKSLGIGIIYAKNNKFQIFLEAVKCKKSVKILKDKILKSLITK